MLGLSSDLNVRALALCVDLRVENDLADASHVWESNNNSSTCIELELELELHFIFRSGRLAATLPLLSNEAIYLYIYLQYLQKGESIVKVDRDTV
jgi:hypothetical protein